MRRILVACCLGFAGLGSLAGCVSNRASHGDTAADQGRDTVPWNLVIVEPTPIATEAVAPRANQFQAMQVLPKPIVAPVVAPPPALPTTIVKNDSMPLIPIEVPPAATAPAKLPAFPIAKATPQVVPMPTLAAPEKEKSAPPKVVNAEQAKAEPFASITGQVQIWRTTVRVRYAPVDREDVYGGSVVLEGIDLSNLRDGQQVRVRGVLIPPTSRFAPARYRVRTVEVLD